MKAKTVAAFNAGAATIAEDARHKPVRQDGPAGRFYIVDGESYPSVTHILSVIGKPALINWAATIERTLVSEAAADLYLDLCRIAMPMSRTAYLTTLQARIGKTKSHQRELAKAGEVGTQVHNLIEWNLRRALDQAAGPEPHVVDAAQWAFMAWQDWATSVNLKPLFIEQMLFSRTHAYAGTMDLLAEVNGVVTLVDFKTGKAIYPEAFLQSVAYQVALLEMGHGQPKAGLIVRLPKVQTDPAFETQAVPPVHDLFDVFLAVKQVWKWSYANNEAYRTRRAAAGSLPEQEKTT